MTEPQRAYETTNRRRYVYDKHGNTRDDLPRCPDCRAVAQDRGNILCCLECGWATAAQVAQ